LPYRARRDRPPDRRNLRAVPPLPHAGGRGGHGRRRCARRPGRRVHAGQGPGAVRARRPDRPARPAHARGARRAGGPAEVRRLARVHPRLAGARPGQRRRLPRLAGLAGLGRQVGGDGARPLHTHRAHPEAGRRLGRLRPRRAAAGHHAHRAARPRAPLLDAGHATDGRTDRRRRRGQPPLARPPPRLRRLGRAPRRPPSTSAPWPSPPPAPASSGGRRRRPRGPRPRRATRWAARPDTRRTSRSRRR